MRFLLLLIIAFVVALPCAYTSAESSYAEYTSTDPLFKVAADYPSGWQVSQENGSYGTYKQIIFYAPLGEGDAGISPGIVLTAENSAKVLTSAETTAEYVAGIVDQRRNIPEYREVSQSTGRMFDEDGMVVECSYKIPDRLHGKEISMMPVRERIVVVKKEGFFYTLRYLNADADFDRFLPDFSHVMQSMRLNSAG